MPVTYDPSQLSAIDPRTLSTTPPSGGIDPSTLSAIDPSQLSATPPVPDALARSLASNQAMVPDVLAGRNEPAGVANPITPIQTMTREDYEASGPRQVLRGVRELRVGTDQPSHTGTIGMYGVPLPSMPMNPTIAQGASDVIGGTMATVAPPLLAAGVVTAPAASLLGLGGSIAAQQTVSRTLKASGVDPAYANLAGNMAALLPIGGAVKTGFETHAAVAAEVASKWQALGDVLEPARQAAGASGDPIDVQIRTDEGAIVPAKIVLANLGDDGRPFLSVVRMDTGKPAYTGTKGAVDEWLAQRVPDPTWLQRWNSATKTSGLSGDEGSQPYGKGQSGIVQQQLVENGGGSRPTGYSIDPATGKLTTETTSSPAEPAVEKPTKPPTVAVENPPSPSPLVTKAAETGEALQAPPEPVQSSVQPAQVEESTQVIADARRKAALGYAREHLDDQHPNTTVNQIQRRFQLGYGAAQDVLAQAQTERETTGDGNVPPTPTPAAEPLISQSQTEIQPGNPDANKIRPAEPIAPETLSETKPETPEPEALPAEEPETPAAQPVTPQVEDGTKYVLPSFVTAQYQKPAEEAETPAAKAPHEQSFSEFRATPQATSVPKNSILARNPDEPGYWDDLADRPKTDIQNVARVMGGPVSGTKTQLVERLRDVWDLRRTLAQATPESLSALSGKELKALADRAGSFKGNKAQTAAGLINWRNHARHNGQVALAEAKWAHAIHAARKKGLAVPDSVLAEARDRGLLYEDNEETPKPAADTGNSAPEATQPTIEAHDLEQPAGAHDSDTLGNPLPEGSGGTPEERPVSAGSGKRSRSRRPRNGAGDGQGHELDGNAGTSSAGVGDPAHVEHVTETLPPRASAPSAKRFEHDYRIQDDRRQSGTPETRARRNIEAIRTLNQIEKEHRTAATVEEQHILAGYGGWGPVPQIFAATTPEWQALQAELKSLVSPEEFESARASTTNANYTDDDHIRAIWAALLHLGAKPGMSWLEPAIGVGNFFGLQPAELLEGARRVGVDKERLVGRIAQLLYPDSGIDIKPFEQAEYPEDYFDAAISNVPFGNFGVHDPSLKPYLTSSIHNYFFAKSLGNVRPGGIIAFITSRYTMDGYDKPIRQFREYMASKADFLGAVRLPSHALQAGGGTHVIADVIFMRRRLPDAERTGESWVETERKTLQGQHGWAPIETNSYFRRHPENILGTETLKRGQFSATDYHIEGKVSREDLETALKRILPADAFQKATRVRSSKVAIRDLNAPEASKLGGLFFDDQGNLFRRTSRGSAVPVSATAGVKARIKGQLQIRNVLAQLMDAERTDKPENQIKELRAALNRVYDAYVAKQGHLSSRSNQAAVFGDPDAPLLTALEQRYDPRAKTAVKAPIFARRMLQKPAVIESAANAKDALYITLNEKGTVDWQRIAELIGKSEAEAQTELSESGLVFQDPKDRTWQTAEEYLSGSVRSKLRDAEKLAKVEPEFKHNVEALEKVQPEDIAPGDIHAALGVTWVPAEVYGQFAQDVLNASQPVKTTHVGNEWILDAPWGVRGASKWSTARVSAHQLLKDALNMRRTKVYDYDSETKSEVINKTETLTAQAKQRELQQYFNTWLFGDAQRGTAMAKLYNELNNDLRLRTYDGSHLMLPGMTRDAAVVRGGDLEPHQKAAIWRMISNPNVLLAHWVGTGKTFEMIAAGMELQRLGLIKRPMYVVPNQTLTGWQLQFNALYPGKRVLVFSEADLEKKRRQQVMAQIATGEWDAVVVPSSSFGLLNVGDDIFEQHFQKLERELEQQVRDAEEAGLDTRIIKRLEKMKERLLTSLQDKRKAEKKDKTVTWEQLGIDQLFVDEAHDFKKLGFTTKQQNVAGIDQAGNQKTFDLLMKIAWTQKHGRGVVFATGTPVTNTIGELFNLMKYLIEPEMEARGLAKFDDWSANFGRTVDVFEPKPEGGGYQMKARFSQFVNLPELAQLFRSFADVVTSDMVDLPRPALKGGDRRAIVSELSAAQQEYLEGLRARAEGIRKDPRGALPDNMLTVYGDAGKMTLDMRLLDPHAQDEPGNRLNRVAEEVHRIWKESQAKRSTQLIFMDLGIPNEGRKAKSAKSTGFSTYDDLTKKLIARGIPAHEIANIYQAKNKRERAKLLARTNDGEIRVLMGSTQKLGVGVNVQNKVIAMHHLDIPHRPSDLDQREGRAIRQGNENPEVEILYYITKGSLDESKFANVLRKAKFINQMLQGKSTVRTAEDVGGMVPSLEMFTAMASGDPRVLRKIEVDAELDRLGAVYSGWRNEQYKNARELDAVPGRLRAFEQQQAAYSKAIAARDKTGRVWTIGKQKFEGDGMRAKLAEALDKLSPDQFTPGEWDPIGTAFGLPLEASRVRMTGVFDGHATSREVLQLRLGTSTFKSESSTGLIQQVENYVKGLDNRLDDAKAGQERVQKDAEQYRQGLDKPWPYYDEYQKLVAEQAELVKALGSDKGDESAAAFEDGAEIKDDSVAAEAPEAEEETEAAEDGEEDDEEDDEDEPRKPTVTLGSGFGAMQPYLDKFMDDTVTPTAKDVAEVWARAKDDMLKLLAPGAREGAEQSHLIVRKNAAELARSTDRAETALQVAGKFFAKQTPAANYEFMDRVEQGQPQASPELDRIASLLRHMLDTRRAAVQALGRGKLENFIEDYFPHIWLQRGPTPSAEQYLNSGKRPLEGTKSFLKKRSIETIADGLAAGLTPVSDNPVDLVLLKTREMDKYLMAHHILASLKENGLLQFKRATAAMPEGYVKINDKAAMVYGTPSHEGALQVEGEWVAPEPAARILNNFLSPGLRDKSALYRGFLGVGNLLNQAQLGFSAFHLSFTTMDVATSKLALGFYQAAHGDVLKGLKSVALTPFSPFLNVMRGDKMLKEWYNPGTQGALIGELVDAWMQAGGRAHMDSIHQTQLTKTMMTAFRAILPTFMSGNPPGAGAKLLKGAVIAPFAAVEQAARPIMEWAVPRQKAGVFADLAQYELERLGTNATDPDVQAALARAQDSVDNRLGQLVYDNLGWNKVVKDLSLGLVRSVGWNVGTIRELGGGGGDTARFVFEAAKLAAGKGGSPDFTPRMSYLLALQLMAGLMGAIAYYLWHGHFPHQLIDYYFPRDAHGHRWSLPTYIKDGWEWSTNPVRTAEGKIHPLISLLWEELANRDFYGKPIANRHHSAVKQAEERALFALEQFIPLGLRTNPGHQNSAQERALGFVGVKPAPRSIDHPNR
jgi:N12 class adenine-specific DNA methylase